MMYHVRVGRTQKQVYTIGLYFGTHYCTFYKPNENHAEMTFTTAWVGVDGIYTDRPSEPAQTPTKENPCA